MASETMPQSRRLLTEYSIFEVHGEIIESGSRRPEKSPSIYFSDGKGGFAHFFRQFLKILCFAQEYSQIAPSHLSILLFPLKNRRRQEKVPPYI